MAKSRKTLVSFTDPVTERELFAVFGDVTQGSQPYFDRAFGGHLPGDPAEAEFLWVEDEEGVVQEYEPTKAELEQWADEAIEQAAEDDRDAYEDACDRLVDEARDARFEV
jgi:hypothetical protein